MGDTEETTGANSHALLLRGCSVVDFIIVSAELYDKVADFSVGDLPKFSDHCPLKLAINLPLE